MPRKRIPRTQTKYIGTSIWIPDGMLEKLEALAEKRGMKRAQLIRWVLEKFVEKEEGETP